MILESIQPVISTSQSVTIDTARLAEVAADVDVAALDLATWNEPPPAVRDHPAALVEFSLLFNTINYCFWGDPKWVADLPGAPVDGATGLLHALGHALTSGIPLLDAAFLAQIDPATLGAVLAGRDGTALPLLDARAAALREAGRVLLEHFDGRFVHVVDAAGGDAVHLVELLVTHFPSWNDVTLWDGHVVRFYKRAQLAAAMLFEALHGQGRGALSGVERLTVFADYKLPQVLRALGILHYSPQLAATIDARRPIPAHSRAEIEIRANTVWACELLRQALAGRRPDVMALHVDFWLWRAGQHPPPGTLPYHRTLTTFY